MLAPAGRLDARTAPAFEQKLLGLIDDGATRFVIDCASLDYVSSAGLRVLLVAAKRLAAISGKIVLAALQGQIRDVVNTIGFETIFDLYGTPEEAVAALASKAE